MTAYPIRQKSRFLVFGAPQIEQEEIEEVVASMRSGWLGTGPKVDRFEKDFRTYIGASHAVAVNSGTAALHLALLACGIEAGDEVITTALTFCASVNAIIHAGGIPVLADVDPVTMNIDPDDVAARITSRTRAILPVHFSGRPCDMDSLCTISRKYGLVVIEDCAHAIESEYRRQKTGTFGEFACFSFYVTKNVVTGEGGMVLAKREEDAAKIKILALHGMSANAWKRFSDEGYKHYFVTECGFKYNMMDLQAAIGLHQLARVEDNWKRRQAIWQNYNQAFSHLPLSLPADPELHTRHAYHLYTILVDENSVGISRDDFLNSMHRYNIGTGVHYLSIPEHPYYQEQYGWDPDEWPNARDIGRTTASLPLSASLTNEDVHDVIRAVYASLKFKTKNYSIGKV